MRETAIRYVMDNPGKAAALVLVDSGGLLENSDDIVANAPFFERAVLASSRIPGVSFVLDRILLSLLEKQTDYYYNGSNFTEEYAARFTAIGRYEKNRGTTRELAVHGSKTYREIEGLEQIDIPTLILWGEKDATVPVSLAHRFDRAIADTELKIYAEVGHIPHLEHPVGSARDLDDFVQRRVRSSRD